MINNKSIKRYYTVDSTNKVAFDLANNSKLSHQWVVADIQTNGKGRHGRSWDSPLGGLYISRIISDITDYKSVSNLGFVASLALYSTINSSITNVEFRSKIKLKWPNDILIDNLKLGGILIETKIINSKTVIVIGFGLNVFEVNGLNLEANKAYLTNYATELKISNLYIYLINSFNNWFCKWDYGNNFNHILESWLSKTCGIGENIQVKTSNEVILGTFLGLNNDGSLLIKENNKKRIINSGEIIINNEK